METIKFTSASTEEILSEINVYKKIKDLTYGMDIGLYTSAITSLLIVFQAFPKNDLARKVLEYKILRRKTQTLELYLILDYERIMNGSDEENLNHIKEVFVKGCETFLKPMKDFKWEEFIQKTNETI